MTNKLIKQLKQYNGFTGVKWTLTTMLQNESKQTKFVQSCILNYECYRLFNYQMKLC